MNFIIKNKSIIIFSIFLSSILVFFLMGSEHFSFKGYLFTESYDLLSDQLAYKFFINDKWHFPFGENPNYGLEVGNSIVFSSGPPIIIFLVKLFKFFLPDDFQYYIIWYIICFSLQLLFSYLIILHFTKNKIFSFLSSLLFLFTPILFYRIPLHTSLLAHWIILICFYFEFLKINNNRIFFYSIILSISLLVHFYFAPMVLLIQSSFLINKVFKTKEIKESIKEISCSIIVLLFVGYISGYFVISAFDAMGFGYGYYSFNLTTLFDSQPSSTGTDWSFFLPDIQNTGGQAEGFGYLGLGGILILIFLLIDFFKKKNKINISYLIIFFICFFLGISNVIYFANNIIYEYQLPKIIYGILSITRASGRFIWLIYYLIFIFGIVSIYRLFNQSRKSEIIIFLILILQFADIFPGLKSYYNAKAFSVFNNTEDSKIFWSKISDNFKVVRTTYLKNDSNIFPSISNQILGNNFNKTDIMRLGRYDRAKASKNRNKLYIELNNKTFDQKTIYVIDNENHLRYLKYLYKNSNIGFFFIDDVWLMIPGYKSKMSNEDNLRFKKIYPIEIKENIKHIFDSRSSKNALGFGWTHSTQKGIWTEGSELNMLFYFKPILDKDYQLRLKVNSSYTNANNNLAGSIYLNSKKIKNFEFQNFKNSEDTFIDILLSDNHSSNNVYKIDIKIDNPVSPLELLKSADARKLGLLIESLEIN